MVSSTQPRFEQSQLPLVWSESYASSQRSRPDGSSMGNPRCPHPRATAPQRQARGRPWKARPSVLNGILWVLTGAPWADLPERYPSYQTCHRRFQQWVRSGIMRGVLEAIAEDLQIRGRLDVREAIDGSFAPAKKGDRKLAKRSVAREQRSWPWQTATVFRWLYPLKVLPPRSEVGRVHPRADGDPATSTESHR